MEQEELLKNEKVEKALSPHPLSFMRYQSLCIFLIVWGLLSLWLVNFSGYDIFDNNMVATAIWALVILAVGVFASIIAIRWLIFFMYLGIVLIGIGLVVWQNWLEGSWIVLPIYTVAMSFIGFLLVEWFRVSHRYIISNHRIIFKGGIVTKEERTLRYDKISDVNSKQGILGQIFGFGTIIPISQSGFGLGADTSFAAGGVQLGAKKAKFMGLFGGGREVQTPRARSYYELHGVYPYKEVKKLVEKMVQGSVITQYQEEQVEFQKEQVDIQKQMRDLLKMQSEGNKEQEPESKEKK